MLTLLSPILSTVHGISCEVGRFVDMLHSFTVYTSLGANCRLLFQSCCLFSTHSFILDSRQHLSSFSVACGLRWTVEIFQAFIRLRPSFISLFLGFTLSDIHSRCLLLICWPAWRPFRVLHMRKSTRAISCCLSLTCSSSQSSDYSSDAVDVNLDVKMQHVPSGNPMTAGNVRTGPVSSQMNGSS